VADNTDRRLTSDEFWRSHPELVPQRAVISKEIARFQNQHPELTFTEVLQTVGPELRKKYAGGAAVVKNGTPVPAAPRRTAVPIKPQGGRFQGSGQPDADSDLLRWQQKKQTGELL
jgi:hypothetical protein